MSYSIKLLSIGETEVDLTNNVLTGFSFVEKLDDTLDIGSMIVRGVTRFEPYSMFDTIEVYKDGVVKFSMRIAGDSVVLIDKQDLLYEHTLSLVEHTKILERYLISGKTFTQPTDGTTEYTLYDAIDILNDTTPFQLSSLVDTTRVFEMPTGDLATYLQSVESPEFTFKDITLREALNQVCGYVEGIPRLVRESDGTLRFSLDFLNVPNDLISGSLKLTNKSTQQDIALYSTSIVSEVQNVVSDNDINESVEVYPAEGSWITPRSNAYIFEYEKSFIPTPKRVYNVNKLQQLVFATVSFASAYNVYDFKKRFYYFDTMGDFPINGSDLDKEPILIDVYFVDISTGIVYSWDASGGVYVSEGALDFTPKIRLYETYAKFTTVGDYTYDVYVDMSTGKTYRYNGSTYIENKNFDLNGNLVLDLTDRVYERNIWNILDETGSNRDDPSNFYKSNTLAYDYREPNIQLGTTSGLFDTGVDIVFIIDIKAFESLQEDGYIPPTDVYSDYVTTLELGGTSTYNSALFRIYYTPIPTSQRVEIDKSDISLVNYESQMLSNQQSRSVNLEYFANNLQGRINRIGNNDLELRNKVKDVNSVNYLNIKDYTDEDFIITERETIIFKEYCSVAYGLTKNFNMISKFIGVNSEVRQYEMGENNTLSRVLSTKEHVELNAVESGVATGSDTTNLMTINGTKCFIDTFNTQSVLEPVRGGDFTTSGTGATFIAPFSSNGSGNTLMFFQQQSTNLAIDYRFDDSGQIRKKFLRYADSVGYADTMTFELFDKVINTNTTPSETNDYGDTIPFLDTATINIKYVDTDNFYVKKDIREELGILYSLAISSFDLNNVIIGRALSTKNRLITENAISTIKIRTYRNGIKLNKTNDVNSPDGYFSSNTISPSDITFDYVNNTMRITHSSMSLLNSSWVLLDGNDEVIIGVNQDLELLDTITFDFSANRTGIKYKY